MQNKNNQQAKKLENITECPVCNCRDRKLLYRNIKDSLFHSPGKWCMWICDNCKSGYLNPRLTRTSIQLAYTQYHTHTSPEQQQEKELSLIKKIRRSLSNGYKNWKYNTRSSPSNKLGILAAHLMPWNKAILDRQFRNLNNPPGSVLDFGAGDGSFLEIAKSIGWEATGIDPDPVTVSNAKKRNLNVLQGGIEVFDQDEEIFDAITICNVLEHLHDPASDLEKCFKLLKPGGRIWIETPNFNSLGHRLYGEYWRGLEPPRHLILFTPSSLIDLLHKKGFVEIVNLKQPSCVEGIFNASEKLRSINKGQTIGRWISSKMSIQAARIYEAIRVGRREFIVVQAIKPRRDR